MNGCILSDITWYLWADLCRYASKLWVWSEGSQVIHSLDERPSGFLTLQSVLLVKGPIKSLTLQHKHIVTFPIIIPTQLIRNRLKLTLMDLTRLAVLLATSLALWTNCLFATGLDVLEEASRQALHKAEVCLATIVAAERTLGKDGALNTGVILSGYLWWLKY